MIIKEAYDKFAEKFTSLSVISCYEYDSRFVFQAVPQRYANANRVNEIFDSLYSVDKNSGKITPFKPTDLPLDEYERGRKLNKEAFE